MDHADSPQDGCFLPKFTHCLGNLTGCSSLAFGGNIAKAVLKDSKETSFLQAWCFLADVSAVKLTCDVIHLVFQQFGFKRHAGFY